MLIQVCVEIVKAKRHVDVISTNPTETNTSRFFAFVVSECFRVSRVSQYNTVS